jgi:poly-beta-1,6-N-acetyl-D-glucosamine N-deacetylase
MAIPALGMLITALAVGSARSQPGAQVYYHDEVAVLTYHDVAQHVPRGTDTVSPEGFGAQMGLLVRDGFTFVSMPRLEQFLSRGAPVPPNAVCVVFDNGYEGIYRYAMPVLRREGIPAAVFLIVGHVAHLAGDFTWPQVQEMSQSGLVRFYTETYDLHHGIAIGRGASVAATVGHGLLPDGAQESDAAYRARVMADLVRARSIVERETGRPVNALVDPYGQYTPEFIDIAHAAGNLYLFTTQGWMVGPHTDPSRLPRLDIGVWDQTPQGVVGAILTVAAAARRAPYTPPTSYVRVWK